MQRFGQVLRLPAIIVPLLAANLLTVTAIILQHSFASLGAQSPMLTKPADGRLRFCKLWAVIRSAGREAAPAEDFHRISAGCFAVNIGFLVAHIHIVLCDAHEQGRVLLPGSAMLEMASAAAIMLRDDGVDVAAALTDVAIMAPFILPAARAVGRCALT